MHTLLAFTPGVLALLQGDEYGEIRAFSSEPPVLDLTASVGVLEEREKEGGEGRVTWGWQGEGFGMFMALRTLLEVRREWGLHGERECSVFWESSEKDVVVMTVNGDEYKVVVFSTWDSDQTKA